MPFTNSSLNGTVGTSLEAANVDVFLCTMRDTNSSLLGLLVTSWMLALAHFAK